MILVKWRVASLSVASRIQLEKIRDETKNTTRIDFTGHITKSTQSTASDLLSTIPAELSLPLDAVTSRRHCQKKREKEKLDQMETRKTKDCEF